jgi:hypothetical protein
VTEEKKSFFVPSATQYELEVYVKRIMDHIKIQPGVRLIQKGSIQSSDPPTRWMGDSYVSLMEVIPGNGYPATDGVIISYQTQKKVSQVLIESNGDTYFRFSQNEYTFTDWVKTTNAGSLAHNLLSGTHPDTIPDTKASGDMLTVDSVQTKWKRLPLGANGSFLKAGTAEPFWGTIQDGDLPGSVVRTSRKVDTLSPLLGGGDLSVDRTLSFDQTVALNNNARVGVKNNGTLAGVRRNINFIPGSNISFAISDDAVNEEVDVTINAAGGGGSVRARTFDAIVGPNPGADYSSVYDAYNAGKRAILLQSGATVIEPAQASIFTIYDTFIYIPTDTIWEAANKNITFDQCIILGEKRINVNTSSQIKGTAFGVGSFNAARCLIKDVRFDTFSTLYTGEAILINCEIGGITHSCSTDRIVGCKYINASISGFNALVTVSYLSYTDISATTSRFTGCFIGNDNVTTNTISGGGNSIVCCLFQGKYVISGNRTNIMCSNWAGYSSQTLDINSSDNIFRLNKTASGVSVSVTFGATADNNDVRDNDTGFTFGSGNTNGFKYTEGLIKVVSGSATVGSSTSVTVIIEDYDYNQPGAEFWEYVPTFRVTNYGNGFTVGYYAPQNAVVEIYVLFNTPSTGFNRVVGRIRNTKTNTLTVQYNFWKRKIRA